MKIFEEAINFTCICEYIKEMKLKNKYQMKISYAVARGGLF
jgi:hypothetical protein